MKLHRSQIELLSSSVVQRLLDDKSATLPGFDETQAVIDRVITEDLQIEDRLNEEVRGILAEHESAMRMQGVQFHDMFKIVKQKLVRERKLIL